MENRTLTVTQLTEIIKLTLDSSPYLGTVAVSGEISNFNHHYASGHMYFTLQDEGAQLKCVMFRFQNVNLRMRPENGMKVLCTGRISVSGQRIASDRKIEMTSGDGSTRLEMRSGGGDITVDV